MGQTESIKYSKNNMKARKRKEPVSENTNTEMYSTPMDQIQQQHQVSTPSAPKINIEKSPIELQSQDELNPHISFPSLANSKSKSDSSEGSSRSGRRMFFLKPRIRLRPRTERPQVEENIASSSVQVVQHDAPTSFVETPQENHSIQIQRPIPRTPQRRESDNDVDNARDDNGWGQNFLDLLGFPPASRKHQGK